MRSLDTSLPQSRNKDRPAQPSEELLQSFKSAALSVTNLYRAAEASERRGVQTGYQDALDDLLAFLDSQNIGLSDGEGWRVRQWATERLDDNPISHHNSESEDEKADLTRPTNHERSDQKKIAVPDEDKIITPPNQTSLSNDEQGPRHGQELSFHDPNVFTFRSQQQLAEQPVALSPAASDLTSTDTYTVSPSSATPALTFNIHPRSSRTLRHPRQPLRTSAVRNLGPVTGTKRKGPFSEYFDFAEIGKAKKSRHM